MLPNWHTMQNISDQQNAQRVEANLTASESDLADVVKDNAAGLPGATTDNQTMPGVVQILAGLEQAKQRDIKQHNINLLNKYAPAAIAIFDRDMHYLSASARWISDFNIKEEVLGLSHYQVFPNISDLCRSYHQRALAGEIIITDNFRFEMPDGAVRWVRLELGPWIDDDSAIGGIVIFTEDNTRSKTAEQEVELGRTKLQAALSSMYDAVFIADEHGTLIDFNEAFAVMHGFKNKAECPVKLSDYPAILEKISADGEIVPPQQWPVFRAMRGEKHSGIEYTVRRKDTGLSVIGSYSFAPLRNGDGLITGAVVSIRDVTQQRRMEQLIDTKRGELEEAGRHFLARQTAAAIAHDLNQPLTAISTYTNVALQVLETDSQNLETLRYALTQAEQQAQRAGKMMHELVASLQKNQSVSEPINIATLLTESVEIVVGKGGYGLRPHLHWQIAPALPPVMANHLQIQKVVINLISNAIQAMQDITPAQAKLTISAEIQQADAALLHICVSDTGIGLTEAELKDVFQAFYSTKATGLGMGLAICRTIISAHGGKLWAESKPGSGASFHFTLPVVK